MDTAGITAGEPGDSGKSTKSLPAFPGQDALLHEAVKWREVRDDVLTDKQLLDVAKGGTPNGVSEIVDVLSPETPPPAPSEVALPFLLY